ncbi:MAG: glycoside hydrolase family 92 protein [Bacteroidales bacterium]
MLVQVSCAPAGAMAIFQSPFDPLSTERQGFIEGNAWNYSLYVPQDPMKLIALHGGNKKFIAHVDSLFNVKLDEKHFAESEDITAAAGLIGNYVHGNEPSHHVPYLRFCRRAMDVQCERLTRL